MYAFWYLFFGCFVTAVVSFILTMRFHWAVMIGLAVLSSVIGFFVLLFSIVSPQMAIVKTEEFMSEKTYYEEVLRFAPKEIKQEATADAMEQNEWLFDTKARLKAYGALSPYSLIEDFEELDPIEIDFDKFE